MTLLQMLVILRRRLNDVPAEVWTDAELTTLINLSLARLAIDITKVDPQAFFSIDDANIVASQYLYQRPSNMIHELALLKLSDTVPGQYSRLERVAYYKTIGREGSSGLVYSVLGNYFVLSPTPTAAQTAGLRVVQCVVPTVSATTDVPTIPIPLHFATVLYADLFASGETGESELKPVTRAMLEGIVASIPLYYRTSGADNDALEVDVDKGY